MTSHAAAPSHNPQRLVLLGSTGSIGTQTLEVLSRLGEHAPRVAALAAGGSRLELLARQAITWEVPVLAVTGGGEDLAGRLRQALRAAAVQAGRPDPVTTILTGPDAATTAVQTAELGAGDTVVNGITGSVGLLPTLAALASGARLALANKESLVVGGALVRQALTRPGQIVPVDSEHSAIAQALASGRHEKGLTSPVLSGRSEVRRLVLTASGGPFRGRSRAELTGISAAAALQHPTWDMGPVVTINSSTLINKGLELIEAHLLFDVAPERIDVVVHPQSVIHSMVEFTDGSTLAQASPPDMRLPIGLALTWPDRLPGAAAACDWTRPATWTFEPLDDSTFPAVELARSAGKAAGTAPAVYNAANEVLVDAFCDHRIGFLGITDLISRCLTEHLGTGHVPDSELTVDAVLAADAAARQRARELVEELS